ncbi:MAG: 6-bladed beta-propeller [Bacteroidales bacterium]|nr:6-bladed beta-propeller [Bacteroidales bacterium]
MKNINKPLLVILLLMSGICSCKRENALPVYSVNTITSSAKEISEKDLNAHIDHIQLETTEKSLIADFMDLVMTKEYFFILTSTPKVLQFTREGKFVRQISMIGNGPGEHRQLFSIFVNENSGRIFIAEIFGRIMEFDFDGAFIGAHKKGDGLSRFIFGKNNNLLESVQVLMGNEPVKLYVMKMDGDTLKRFENHLKYEFTISSVSSSYGDYKSMFTLDGKIIYHQISTDTVFTYNPNSLDLEPRYCFSNPGGPDAEDFKHFREKMPELYLIYDVAEDNNFIYVSVISPPWKRDLYMIDKKSEKYYQLNFPLSDDPEKQFMPRWQYNNCLIDFVNKQDDINPELVIMKIAGISR